MRASTTYGWFDHERISDALGLALRKLDPRYEFRNTVIFVVEIGAVITSMLTVGAILGLGREPAWFVGTISLWLWFTVLFANTAEALAEERGKARAASLRRARRESTARRIPELRQNAAQEMVSTGQLKKGDLVLIGAGETIPADGEVRQGVAAVDESAVTGESAPVIREPGDHAGVSAGTMVVSDWLIVEVTRNPGEMLIDRMITLIEGAQRHKTPNEIALTILLTFMTIVFLLATATLLPFSIYSADAARQGDPVTLTVLIALLVCLIPTTIGGLLSAIGIAGMDRLMRANVLAMSGRAIEAAGDVDTLLLDKTGTITYGNRRAVSFIPVQQTDELELATVAQLASIADETPEGRSIVALAHERYRAPIVKLEQLDGPVEPAPFTAETRMSGINLNGTVLRKGAVDAIERHVAEQHRSLPTDIAPTVERIASEGGTPLVVARDGQALGVIELRDVVKPGIRERFDELRRMGIRTVMVTGDNPLTAATIAHEAGVDDYLAQATPEAKLELIREYQAGGRLVAMSGDGTNDAPALAQADVALAMNSGTQVAKEAANLIDLDSDPTKLIEVVGIGKQLLMTRGALTTFSIANDLAKYLAIIPAMFTGIYPQLDRLNLMRLHSPESAILSAVIFNALIIIMLVPLALRGVRYRPASAESLLRRNLLIYGLGGTIAPFIGIKVIDLGITNLGLV